MPARAGSGRLIALGLLALIYQLREHWWHSSSDDVVVSVYNNNNSNKVNKGHHQNQNGKQHSSIRQQKDAAAAQQSIRASNRDVYNLKFVCIPGMLSVLLSKICAYLFILTQCPYFVLFSKILRKYAIYLSKYD